jgi:hypothetical protein
MVEGFEIQDIQHIGHTVYEPSANNYYIQNRQLLADRLKTKTFPYAKISEFVEKTFSQGSVCELPGLNLKGR